MTYIIIIILLLAKGPEQVFTAPKLKKEIKTHVQDETRQEELLEILKIAKKKIKAFDEQNSKAMKQMKKLLKDKEPNIGKMDQLLESSMTKRQTHQAFLVDHRLKMQNLMTDEEWNLVIENAVSPSDKNEKKEDKDDRKEDKEIEKHLERVEGVITEKIDDETKKQKVMTAYQEYQKDWRMMVEKVREMNYQTNDIVNSRSASREELEDIYAEQNELRLETYESFTKLYKVASENTTVQEWKAIRKSLRKIFKQSPIQRLMNKIR